MLAVTLKSHSKPHLTIPSISYGSNVQQMMNNLNQFRGPDNQITKLYNPLGQDIPQVFWSKLQIRENMSFYIDQPKNQLIK